MFIFIVIVFMAILSIINLFYSFEDMPKLDQLFLPMLYIKSKVFVSSWLRCDDETVFQKKQKTVSLFTLYELYIVWTCHSLFDKPPESCGCDMALLSCPFSITNLIKHLNRIVVWMYFNQFIQKWLIYFKQIAHIDYYFEWHLGE